MPDPREFEGAYEPGRIPMLAALLMPSRGARVASVAICAALLGASLLCAITSPPGQWDDSIQLTGAMFILQGLQPHVDFNSVYPPLNYYLLAGAFRALGSSFVTYRLFQIAAYLVCLGVLGSMFLTSRRAGRTAYLLPPALLLLNATLPQLQVLTALMWSAIGALALLRAHAADSGRRRGWLVSAGICLGALAMTRINFALYFLAAYGLDWLLSPPSWLKRWKSALAELAFVALPALLTSGAILLASGSSVVQVITQAALVPMRALKDAELVPVSFTLSAVALREVALSGIFASILPALWLAVAAQQRGRRRAAQLLYALAAAIFACAILLGAWAPSALPVLVLPLLVALVIARLRFDWLPQSQWFLLVLLTLQLHYVLSRPSWSHFFAVFPVLSMLAIATFETEPSREVFWRLASIVTVVCFPALISTVKQVSSTLREGVPNLAALPELLRTGDEALLQQCDGRCSWKALAPDELAAASYIRSHTRPNDVVFSGLQVNARNDSNDLRAYWLMRRPPATHQVLMGQGMTHGAEAEAAIVQDLRESHASWLLLWIDPGSPRQVQYPSALDAYVHAQFRLESSFGNYQVWHAAEAKY